MHIRYEEWLGGSAELAEIVTAYWRVSGDGSNIPMSEILPDGHVELVFNLGDPVGLSGPAYNDDQPLRAVVGPLSKAIRLIYRGPVNTFGIRFHPARGAGFFGKVATDLTDKLLPLAAVCPRLDGLLERVLRVNPRLECDAGRTALERALAEQLAFALPPDDEITATVDRLTATNELPSVAQIADEVGISPRQLQRRFLSAVGVPPKRFVRVVRFARVWQLATMCPKEKWAVLAAEHGYADQAHLVREFRAFGAKPPTHLFTPEWYDATELSRVSGPAPGVRSVQDSRRKRRV
jgi:AraC-like DNA-binding protein